MANPFQRSVSMVPMGDPSYFPPAPAAPGQQAMPSSRLPPPREIRYNPLTDPEGPLARRTVLGALFATGPTRAEYYDSLEQQRKRQAGEARGRAYQKLSALVQEGLPPQQAFLTFLNTPEGMDFVISDPDPQEAVKQFMQLATPDPIVAARQAAFGGVGEAPQVGAPAQQNEAVADPNAYVDPAVSAPNAQPQTPGGEPMPAGPKVGEVDMAQLPPEYRDQTKLRDGAFKLLVAGDEEGARLALTLAEQLDKQAEANRPPTTDELKEYDRYAAQEKAAGREPMPWLDYKVKVASAGSAKEDPELALRKARMDVDKDAAKAAAEAAVSITRALPALEEVERIAGTTQGGYKGALIPYLNRIATSFGIETPDNWSDAEAINAISMQLVPLVRQPGQVSNYEQQTYMQAVPSLLQSPEGRQKIIKIMKKQAKRAQEIAKVYRENLGAADLYDKIAALDKPMFTPEELTELKQLGAGEGGDKTQVDQETGFKVGDVREGKGGKMYKLKALPAGDRNNWEAVIPDNGVPTGG